VDLPLRVLSELHLPRFEIRVFHLLGEFACMKGSTCPRFEIRVFLLLGGFAQRVTFSYFTEALSANEHVSLHDNDTSRDSDVIKGRVPMQSADQQRCWKV